MFDNSAGLKYHIFKDYFSFDEKMSTCGTLRKVQWVKEGNEPDESKAKLEIRKIKVSEDGETTLKGYSFSTEEGPSELAIELIKAGFGDTGDILRNIRGRDDFKSAVENINNDTDESSGEMLDIRELLAGFSEDGDLEVVNF